MEMIMIVAGIVGGWKAGKPFDCFGLSALALFSLSLYAIAVLLLSGFVGLTLDDWQVLLIGWVVLLLYGAVPFVIAGGLKHLRERNRAGE